MPLQRTNRQSAQRVFSALALGESSLGQQSIFFISFFFLFLLLLFLFLFSSFSFTSRFHFFFFSHLFSFLSSRFLLSPISFSSFSRLLYFFFSSPLSFVSFTSFSHLLFLPISAGEAATTSEVQLTLPRGKRGFKGAGYEGRPMSGGGRGGAPGRRPRPQQPARRWGGTSRCRLLGRDKGRAC